MNIILRLTFELTGSMHIFSFNICLKNFKEFLLLGSTGFFFVEVGLLVGGVGLKVDGLGRTVGGLGFFVGGVGLNVVGLGRTVGGLGLTVGLTVGGLGHNPQLFLQ